MYGAWGALAQWNVIASFMIEVSSLRDRAWMEDREGRRVCKGDHRPGFSIIKATIYLHRHHHHHYIRARIDHMANDH